MPHFYFDIHDDAGATMDNIGIDLRDDQAARDEGLIGLAEMVREYVVGPEPQKDITMRVRNEAGEILIEIAISFAVKQKENLDTSKLIVPDTDTA